MICEFLKECLYLPRQVLEKRLKDYRLKSDYYMYYGPRDRDILNSFLIKKSKLICGVYNISVSSNMRVYNSIRFEKLFSRFSLFFKS